MKKPKKMSFPKQTPISKFPKSKPHIASGSSKPSELQRKVMKGKSADQKVSGKFPRKGY